MSAHRFALATIATALLLSACSGDDGPTDVAPPPTGGVTSGTAVLSVTAAPAGLAAVRLRVSGTGISSPSVRGNARILFQQTVADTTFFFLALTEEPAAFLQVNLADKSKIPTVVVQEATAGRLDGYVALTAAAVVVNTTIP